MVTAAEHAEMIFTGGRVHTVNAANDIAEAVAIAGERILAVGSNAQIRALAGPGTREIELRGRSLLPGFIDAHTHLTFLGETSEQINCKAPGMQSIPALVEAVRARAQRQPPGTWIRAWGYDQRRLAEGRHPNRFDLDPVSPDHPVAFTRACGHIAVYNSKAMALAGVDDRTPDPPGGRWDRDGGRNLGVAYESARAPFFGLDLPSPERLRAAILRAQQAYLEAGGTSVHDAGGLMGEAFGQAQRLRFEGKLRLRVYAFATRGREGGAAAALVESGVHTGLGDERLRIGAHKIITDGSTSGPSGATRQPYDSNPDDMGILYFQQDELDAIMSRAHRAGFQCTVHAVGDRAIEQTLDAMARAQHEHPRAGLRHRIEHCAILPPDLQRRVKAQGIVPAMQPAFFWEFGDGYIRDYGRHRADVMFPVKSLLAMGVMVAGSSDAAVTDHRPLLGIEQAMTRATSAGDVCGPEERVDLTTAIRLHTINGAYASFEEGIKGSIEPGKLADLVLLAEDISRVPAAGLRDLPVLMTVIGGVVEYEAR